MNFALNTLKDTVVAINEASVDTGLKEALVRLSNQQKVLPAFVPLPYVRSPLLEVLEDNYSCNTEGMSHVLYAEPSVGKTTACRIFVEKLMPEYDAPALMISGHATTHDYFDHMANLLGVKKKGYDWIASLFAALTPATKSDRARAVLILDEFNQRGPDDINLKVAEALFRQVYNNRFGFTLIFVTQNRDVANALCSMNKWQKIGPLPGLTEPDRWTVDKEKGAPDKVVWKPLNWPLERLTILVLNRYPGKFDSEKDGSGNLPWLSGLETPTEALEKAVSKRDERCGQRKRTPGLP